MASSRSAILSSCRSRDQGCCTRRRRAATAGCSAAIQKRSVDTTSFRRERSSRYSATDTAETVPNTARNWRNDKFRKYTALPFRAPDSKPRFLLSSDASYTDQVSKNYTFQGLRSGNTGVAAASAHGSGLQCSRVLVESARIALARVVVEIELHGDPGFGVAQLQFPGPWRYT